MKEYVYKIGIIILCFSLPSCATLSINAEYRNAVDYAKKQDYDKAFMKLKAFLLNNPDSLYAPKASFAIAEYYLDNNDYADAQDEFYKYLKNYPNDPGAIFAQLIIYKISVETKNIKEISLKEKEITANIREKVFSKPIFFIFFENRKSFSYRSVFGNSYTAYDYVDKLKVIRNGKLFIELKP